MFSPQQTVMLRCSPIHRAALAPLCAALLLLGGCSWFGGGNDTSREDNARNPAPGARAEADRASCGADRLDELVGQSLEPGVRQQIVDLSHAGQYRVLGPKTASTPDYQPQRLDIHLDSDQRISGFDCG